MNNAMKVGDVVRLKSVDGPWMTVVAINDFVTCNWFVNNQELRCSVFPTDSLEKKSS